MDKVSPVSLVHVTQQGSSSSNSGLPVMAAKSFPGMRLKLPEKSRPRRFQIKSFIFQKGNRGLIKALDEGFDLWFFPLRLGNQRLPWLYTLALIQYIIHLA